MPAIIIGVPDGTLKPDPDPDPEPVSCDEIENGHVPLLVDGVYHISTWKELMYLSHNIQDSTVYTRSSSMSQGISPGLAPPSSEQSSSLSLPKNLSDSLQKPSLSDTYQLVADIVLPNAECKKSFVPIGNATVPFSGVFIGNGHRISGLYIHDESLINAGLFGLVSGINTGVEVIQDLVLNTPRIEAHAIAGALAGHVSMGIVRNVHAVGNSGVITKGWAAPDCGIDQCSGKGYTGGLIGVLGKNASLRHASSELYVSAEDGYIGGLVGFALGAVNGYASGNVAGDHVVGGMVGQANGTVQGFASGSISGNWYVGGLAGVATGEVRGYATGKIYGLHAVGGLVGQTNGSVHGYAKGDVLGSNEVGGLIGHVAQNSTVKGYARGHVMSTYGSTGIAFGHVVGYAHADQNAIYAYYSVTSDGSESGLFQLDSYGHRQSYGSANPADTQYRIKNTLGIGVSITDMLTRDDLRDVFSGLDDFDANNAKWALIRGMWPTVVLDVGAGR